MLHLRTAKKAVAESSSDEFAEAVEDLENVVTGKPIRRRKKKKKKVEEDANTYTNRFPAEEDLILAQEFVPLGDQGLARTDRKGLLNARVIFVIGKLHHQTISELFSIVSQ